MMCTTINYDLIVMSHHDFSVLQESQTSLSSAPPAPSSDTFLLLSPLDTMAKSSSNKRKQASQPANTQPHKKPAAVVSAAVIASTPADDDDTLLAGLLYPDELEASIDVLRTLAANPELMKVGSTKSLNGGQVKAFKSAMWDCWRAMGEVTGTGAFDLPSVPSLLCFEADNVSALPSDSPRLQSDQPDLDDAVQRPAPRVARPPLRTPPAPTGA